MNISVDNCIQYSNKKKSHITRHIRLKFGIAPKKNEHTTCETGHKPSHDLESALKLSPDSSPARRLNVNARDGKKADSVTETIRSAWRGVTLAARAGFARGCQRGRNRGCRFEQELGCYANWKDNNRLSEDGCVDGLADERGTTSPPGKHADLLFFASPSGPPPYRPSRSPSREII